MQRDNRVCMSCPASCRRRQFQLFQRAGRIRRNEAVVSAAATARFHVTIDGLKGNAASGVNPIRWECRVAFDWSPAPRGTRSSRDSLAALDWLGLLVAFVAVHRESAGVWAAPPLGPRSSTRVCEKTPPPGLARLFQRRSAHLRADTHLDGNGRER